MTSELFFSKRIHYIARLNSFNPGLTKPGLKTFEQYKFNRGLVNPSFKPGLGLNQDKVEQPGPAFMLADLIRVCVLIVARLHVAIHLYVFSSSVLLRSLRVHLISARICELI